MVAIRTINATLSGESPGFLENPVNPLNSVGSGQIIRSQYDEFIQEAPSFSNNPLYLLNHVNPVQTLPSLNVTITEGAPGFAINPAYALNYVAPSQTLPTFYNMGGEKAPILSNEAFGHAHPLLYNNVGWEAPAFPNRLAYPPDSNLLR